MRRILVEQGRGKQTGKHGGWLRLDLPKGLAADLVATDETLSRLEGHDPDPASGQHKRLAGQLPEGPSGLPVNGPALRRSRSWGTR
jgi:hypothetical protein